MPYIAKKSVRFDRTYSIGETIPDAVVDPRRAESLIGMGRITPAPDQEDAAEEAAQEPAVAGQEPEGVNGPGEPENAADDPTEAKAEKKRGAKK